MTIRYRDGCVVLLMVEVGGRLWECELYRLFYCQFEKPFEKYGVWSVDVPAGLDRKNRLNEDPEWQKQVAAKVMPMCSEAEGKHLGFYRNSLLRQENRC